MSRPQLSPAQSSTVSFAPIERGTRQAQKTDWKSSKQDERRIGRWLVGRSVHSGSDSDDDVETISSSEVSLEEDWPTAADILRRNDPDSTTVTICLSDERDSEIAEALEQNNFVTKLWIEGMEDHALWPLLCRVLATRAHLEEVTLSMPELRRASWASCTCTRLLIEALQQNQSIQSAVFRHLEVPEEVVASFLDTARSVTKFGFRDPAIIPNPGTDRNGSPTIAAALQRNQQIRELDLDVENESLAQSILRSLVANQTVRILKITLRQHYTIQLSVAIQQLLESTSSIQAFELKGHFSTQTLRPIAEGLTNSRTVVETAFRGCNFRDAGSVRLLSNLIRSKRNLCSLTLFGCGYGFIEEHDAVHSALTAALLRSNSSLRFLSLDGSLLRWWSITNFRALLGAAKKSQLEEFSIGGMSHFEQHCQALVEILPVLKITKFSFCNQNAPNEPLLQALQQNFSLRSASIDGFGDDDNERLQFCLDRNKRLAQWVDNPLTVPKHLWPDAMTLAMEAGESTLFQTLLTLSGHAIGSMQSKRKRKRTSFYEPS